MADPAASVVIITKDRPVELAAAMRALRALTSAEGEHELIIVYDGEPPSAATLAGARVIEGPGAGFAGARNAGLEAARGEIVCFTDDDCVPSPDWADAAIRHLREHPEEVGVQGPISSAPWDPLYAHSMRLEAPLKTSFWTANIAYRRALLQELGGFDARLSGVGEDLDLGLRALGHGPIGWSERMRVEHTPKAVDLRQIVGRGGRARQEALLHELHAEHFGRAARVPHRAFPLVSILHIWAMQLRSEGPRVLLRPQRLGRILVLATGQLYRATKALVTGT
jgi:GT2 family glycosyltransferase